MTSFLPIEQVCIAPRYPPKILKLRQPCLIDESQCRFARWAGISLCALYLSGALREPADLMVMALPNPPAPLHESSSSLSLKLEVIATQDAWVEVDIRVLQINKSSRENTTSRSGRQALKAFVICVLDISPYIWKRDFVRSSTMASRALKIDSKKTETTESEQRREHAQSVEKQTAALAYLLWQKRGCPIGTDQEDWFQAEETLRTLASSHGIQPERFVLLAVYAKPRCSAFIASLSEANITSGYVIRSQSTPPPSWVG
jgi:hypothetical protein